MASISRSLNEEAEPNQRDIEYLETGMYLNKLHTNKKGFNYRYYKIDLKLKQITATTEQFMKEEKICMFFFYFDSSLKYLNFYLLHNLVLFKLKKIFNFIRINYFILKQEKILK